MILTRLVIDLLVWMSLWFRPLLQDILYHKKLYYAGFLCIFIIYHRIVFDLSL